MDVDPFSIEPPRELREAYAKDLIDLETYERFVGYYLAGTPCQLPAVVMQMMVHATLTDAPGQVIYYRPPERPEYAA